MIRTRSMTRQVCNLQLAFILAAGGLLAAPPQAQPAGTAPTRKPVAQMSFPTAAQAAEAFIAAAETFDLPTLKAILGPGGEALVDTGEPVNDRESAKAAAAQARRKLTLTPDPKHPDRMTLMVGLEDWPLPIPLVKKGGAWHFDGKAGRREVFLRRIGWNELDVIQICHGYVEAQREFATLRRAGSGVNQYAQRIISTPGRQDGLAWKFEDGSWGGPLGENVARALSQGYTPGASPYRGYFFKALKGQGKFAPLGELDFVVKGLMIGGFALVAAPAEYGITGIKTFMVSHDGIVYEKDLGKDTLRHFKAVERYNPDPTWKPVKEE